MSNIRILLADDHLLLAECIAQSLRQKHFEVVGIAYDGRAMIEMAHHYKPDVIVADIAMPQLNGIEAAGIIRNELPSTRILLLTMHSDLPLIEQAFRVGVNGFITKDSGEAELITAIQTVCKKKKYIAPSLQDKVLPILTNPRSSETALSSRQRQILQLLAEGKTTKEAASIMNISTRTGETHKYAIMRRLGIGTSAELIRHAVRMNLV
jgi:DNA-binding NarL/FixJ family response regulator